MKYLIFTLIIGSLFLGNAFASEDRVFDSCGNSAKYTSFRWYPTLEKKILNIAWNIQKNGLWVLTDWYAELDFCYSKSLGRVIVNIPFVENTKFKECVNDYSSKNPEKHPCKDVLNIFSYNLKTKTLIQAKRPKNVIYASSKNNGHEPWDMNIYMYTWNNVGYQDSDFSLALVNGFSKRVWDTIRMTSWYGDAGCWLNYTWWYNFRTNNMSLLKSDNWCSN